MGESEKRGKRFKNHLKNNVVPLKSNVYINPSDPRYYEKILQYIDRKSPEAHYYLAQKYLANKNRQKAVYHLSECLKVYSPFYHKAKLELKGLQTEYAGAASEIDQTQTFRYKRAIFILSSALALSLFLIWLFTANISPVRSLIINRNSADVGLNVVYETTEKPFLIYIPYDTPSLDIEKLLYDKAKLLGSQNPRLVIQLYGLYASSGSSNADNEPLPLRNEELRKQAFVLAEYHADTDESVRIRFISSGVPESTNRPLRIDPSIPAKVRLGANMVRTALMQYEEDHGKLPDHIQELLGDYPNNYLSFIPVEAETGKNDVLSEYDGAGGWVYVPTAGRVEDIFRPNLPRQIPYDKIELIVAKEEHAVYVINGSNIVGGKKVGIGRNNSTPEGEFEIEERVLDPIGSKPGVYGKAGLGFGDYALHGTNNRTSVGKEFSLGCVRMLNKDVIELFPLVPKGTKLRILSSAPDISESFALEVLSQEISHTNGLLAPTKPNAASVPLHRETAEGRLFTWLG